LQLNQLLNRWLPTCIKAISFRKETSRQAHETMTKLVRLRYFTGFLGLFTLLLIIFIFGAPFWKISSSEESSQLYDTVVEFDGLWLSCLFVSRNMQCMKLGFQSGVSSSVNTYSETDGKSK